MKKIIIALVLVFGTVGTAVALSTVSDSLIPAAHACSRLATAAPSSAESSTTRICRPVRSAHPGSGTVRKLRDSDCFSVAHPPVG